MPELVDHPTRGAIHVAHHAVHTARRAGPVTHSLAALSFLSAGSARIESGGTWALRPGDLLLIPAGQAHEMLESSGARSWSAGFCAPCLAAERAGALLEPMERVRAGVCPVVRIAASRRRLVESWFRELAAAAARRDPGAEAVQWSLLTLILDEAARSMSVTATPGASSLVGDSLRFIERNCFGPLTLADVARAVRRSPAHVTTALRRATGRSAVSWIIAGRLAEARRRLVHSAEMVEVIAERVGYRDATHFIRVFRREHGVTPAAWRARHAAVPVTARRRSPAPA
ncbi:MAG: AraC family transcriptional regulator [Polyangiaceae bacterium]